MSWRWKHHSGEDRGRRRSGEGFGHCESGPDSHSRRFSLAEVEPGTKVRICCLEGEGPLIRRLAEMGFTPGVEVEVLRRAPLSDPIEFQIRGYLLSLRREEARRVHIVVCSETFKSAPATDNKAETARESKAPPSPPADNERWSFFPHRLRGGLHHFHRRFRMGFSRSRHLVQDDEPVPPASSESETPDAPSERVE